MSNEDLTNTQMTAEADEPENGIDIFAMTVSILSEWRLGIIAAAVVALSCVAIVFSLKPQYVAQAVVLPQAGRSSDNGLASLFSNHGPGQLYVGLLDSRSVQDNVVEHAKLEELYHVSSKEKAREILKGKSSFNDALNNLVTISIRDGNAQDAARIANAYLDALQSLNESMAFQESSQTTKFFEYQLEQEREHLATSEQELAQTQRQTGLVASDAQTTIGLNAIAATRAEITGRQVELAALLQSETDENPHVQTLRSQIAQLQTQEHRLEVGAAESPVGAAPPAGQMPKSNLDLARALRQVKYHDELVTSLSKEFETSRLNEAFSRSAFQVVDRAVVPERKAWPPRTPFLLASLVFGALMGLVAIVCKLAWLRIAADPGHQTQMARLRKAFGAR